MSTTQNTIQVGKATIKPRITNKLLKRVKSDAGIDLTSDDAALAAQFLMDPLLVEEVVWGLYEDQFLAADMTAEDLSDEMDVELVERFRAEVDKQMRGFSALWQMISTKMEELRNGSIDLPEFMGKMQMMQGGATGPTS